MKALTIDGHALWRSFTSDPWRGATLLCIITFSIFALILSTITLASLFDSPFAPLIAFVVMLSVQTFSAVNAVSLFQPFSKTDAVVALIAWAFLTTMSVVTNWGVWFDWLGAKDYARSIYVNEAQEIADTAALFAARYDRVAKDATTLADHSKAMAALEDSKGGSCRDGSGKTQGPRWKLRMDDAASFGAMAQYFQAQSASAQSTAQALSDAVRAYDHQGFGEATQRIQSLYGQLRTIGVDPELQRVPKTLETRLETAKNGFTVDGQTIRCSDPELEALTQRLKAALALPEVPARPTLFEPTMKNSIQMAYGEMLSQVIGFKPDAVFAPNDSAALAAERRQILANPTDMAAKGVKGSPWLWFLAALPDLMILLAAWRLAMRDRSASKHTGAVSSPFQRLAAWKNWSTTHALGDVSFNVDGKEYNSGRMLEVLLPWIGLTPRVLGRRRRGAVCDIFVPTAVQASHVQELTWVMTVLEALKAAWLVNPATRVQDLPRGVLEKLPQNCAGVIAHYELDRAFYEDLVFHALGRLRKTTSAEAESLAPKEAVTRLVARQPVTKVRQGT